MEKPTLEKKPLYIGDALSLLRVLSLIPMVYFVTQDEWWLALLMLTLGWLTDLLDGPAARRWGSLRDRKPGFDADGLADTAMAFGSSMVPLVYAYLHYGVTTRVVLTVIYALTIISGIAMVAVMNQPMSPARRALVAFNMIVMHGIVQIGGTFAWFLFMATSNRDGSIALAVTILAVVGIIQARKIELWLEGRFE